MEDTEIAKGVISRIIEEEIVQLEVWNRELPKYRMDVNGLVTYLNFKAIIKKANKGYKIILIELQKAQSLKDILRLRTYWGLKSQSEESITVDGITMTITLPIVPIYFIGSKLKQVNSPLLYVHSVQETSRPQKPLDIQEEFADQLNHDAYIIQIGCFGQTVETELENILKVFNQNNRSDYLYMLQLQEQEVKENEFLVQLTDRLRYAATTCEILNHLEIEDEFERTLYRYIRERHEAEEELEKIQSSASNECKKG